MEFRVLGAVELVGGGAVRSVGGPQARRLLAALLAHRRRVVSIDALAEVLWGDELPETARPTLQTAVSRLRRLLESDPSAALTSRPPGFVLSVEPSCVDADRFEQGLAAGRSVIDADPGQALSLISLALDEWSGSAFAEFAAEPWALAEATRLEELRLQAIEARNRARLDLGDAGSVIGELEGLALLEPVREEMWGLLARGFHRAGRQAEALRVTAHFRRHLRHELGLEPSAAFTALERRILDGEGAPDVAGAPAVAMGTRATVAAPFPSSSASIFGRDAAIVDAIEACRSGRVVTLSGPGGVGKSTLAIEVARRLAAGFRDGVRVVELAPVSDDAVTAAIAQSVVAERRAERSHLESIAKVLGPLELLLVLDNCEHVLGRVGEVVRHIVRWCPTVTVLATSREPIGIPGEAVRTLAPLAVPADPNGPFADIAAAPAVEAFVARAADAAPGFELTERSAPIVAEICIQLDGLPLALELAAARMSALTPRQLADRLHERFSLLGSGPGRSPRHRSLIDVVQWSYALLDPAERTTFARLSVFAGGFDLDAAEQVAGVGELRGTDIAPVLSGLVDKSLVTATRDGEHVWYSQLETLRHFGASRLAEQPEATEVLRAHVATYVARALDAAVGLEGPDEGAWAAQMDRDTGNLRTALNSAISIGDSESALTLVTSVREFAFRYIRYELIDWAERVLKMAHVEDHPLMPTALAVVAYGAFVRGELDRAVALASEAIEHRRRLGAAPDALAERVLGNTLFYQGQRDVAIGWIDRLVELGAASGVASHEAHACYMRSVAQTSIGDVAGAVRFAERSLGAAQAAQSPTALAHAMYAVGFANSAVDPGRAVEQLEASSALADSVGNRWLRSFARTEVYWLRARQGETAAALAGYQEVIDTWFRGGEWANQWLSLRQLAGILAALGIDDEAALLFGAVDAAGATQALPLSPLDADEIVVEMRALADRLGESAFRAQTSRGARMREEAAVDLALTCIERALERLGR